MLSFLFLTLVEGFLKEAGGSIASTTYEDVLEFATDAVENVYPMHWQFVQALLLSASLPQRLFCPCL